MEELLFGLDLRREELDVVDEQDVVAAVVALEALHRAVADCPHELVRERLDGRVADGEPTAVGLNVVPDRVQEVGFTDAGRAIDEQRVVGLPGQLGDGERGRMREPVRIADDELPEGVLRVEPLALGWLVRGCRLRGGGRRSARRLAGGHSGANVDADVAQDGGRGPLQDPREALGDPRAQLGRGFDDERVALESGDGESGKPDVVHRCRDRLAQLLVDAL